MTQCADHLYTIKHSTNVSNHAGHTSAPAPAPAHGNSNGRGRTLVGSIEKQAVARLEPRRCCRCIRGPPLLRWNREQSDEQGDESVIAIQIRLDVKLDVVRIPKEAEDLALNRQAFLRRSDRLKHDMNGVGTASQFQKHGAQRPHISRSRHVRLSGVCLGWTQICTARNSAARLRRRHRIAKAYDREVGCRALPSPGLPYCDVFWRQIAVRDACPM
mmetsp:Transcript_102127/g.288421  ORF Transcript_102127/g.288421 Transcript_102127/m.288421 type:complete len:216 (+) Transcript_102127:221-868(+)